MRSCQIGQASSSGVVVRIVAIVPKPTRRCIGRGRIDAEIYDIPGGKVLIGSVARRDGRTAKLDMQYLVVSGEGVQHVSEPLKPGLWMLAEYEGLLSDQQLIVDYDPTGLMGAGTSDGLA